MFIHLIQLAITVTTGQGTPWVGIMIACQAAAGQVMIRLDNEHNLYPSRQFSRRTDSILTGESVGKGRNQIYPD